MKLNCFISNGIIDQMNTIVSKKDVHNKNNHLIVLIEMYILVIIGNF